jgi:hypothetical protein
MVSQATGQHFSACPDRHTILAGRLGCVVAIYRILQKSGFGPDEIQRMTDAYEAALKQRGLRRDDPLTETIARHIIEIAQTGEKDSARICALALERLARS